MRDIILSAMHAFPGPWRLLEAPGTSRLRPKAEAILVTDRAVLAFAGTSRAAEDTALDLADFHPFCRAMPVLPVVLAAGRRAVAQPPLPFPGAAPVLECSRLLLPGLLGRVATFPLVPGAVPQGWDDAEYRPVPGLLAAAAGLWARYGNTTLEIAAAHHGDLARTSDAVAALIAAGRKAGHKQVIFVTGPPGAGKTLCGLQVAFAPGSQAAFLTANPTLLHVLRATLRREAPGRAASRQIDAVIQPLHHFRDAYARGGVPPERILVIDEAQRCWTAEYAIRKTLNKAVRLSNSEAFHVLEALNRHEGPVSVVCLAGNGQEIHAGEGGLAGWGTALAALPGWTAYAPPPDPEEERRRLPDIPGLTVVEALHLATPVRSFGAPSLSAWAAALLAGDAMTARLLAGGEFPVHLTRSLAAARAFLAPRTGRRAGLLASSGARRLRAEGLGGTLPHQDEDAVARWFIDAWPDIRSSDALEVAATEFGAQGLELDETCLCWDLDLRRHQTEARWEAHAFRATDWTRPLRGEARSNKLNAYRVLLTRSRRRLVIWVPPGSGADPTRPPAEYDRIASFLLECGVRELDGAAMQGKAAPSYAGTRLL